MYNIETGDGIGMHLVVANHYVYLEDCILDNRGLPVQLDHQDHMLELEDKATFDSETLHPAITLIKKNVKFVMWWEANRHGPLNADIFSG